MVSENFRSIKDSRGLHMVHIKCNNNINRQCMLQSEFIVSVQASAPLGPGHVTTLR